MALKWNSSTNEELGILDIITIINSIPLFQSLVEHKQNSKYNIENHKHMHEMVLEQKRTNEKLDKIIHLLENNKL